MADIENQELDALKQDMEQHGIQPTDSALARTVQEQEIAGFQAQQQQPRQQPIQEQGIRRGGTAYFVETAQTADRKHIACSAIYCLLLISAPAIAAVVVASQYDKYKSPCNNGTQYLVDLDIYLYVAGGVQLGIFAIFSLSQIIALLCCGEDAWLKIKKILENAIFKLIILCYPLFHIAWACVGIYIYSTEMSKDCRNESIGQMILSWIIIEFICVCGLMSCCVCAGMTLAGAAIANER
eukprot:533543_1